MTTAAQKLALVHAHVEEVRRDRPEVELGRKYARVLAVLANPDAKAEILAFLDERAKIAECIAELREQDKDCVRAVTEKYAMDPKTFNWVLGRLTRPGGVELEELLAAERGLLGDAV